MMNIDVRSLLERMNVFCTGALEGAAGLCVSRTHYEVTVEHYLSRLLEEPQSDMTLLLRQADVDVTALKYTIDRDIDALSTGNPGRPVFSPLLIEWLQDAWLVSSINFRENVIRSGARFVITGGHCGPKAFEVLRVAGVKVYVSAAPSVAEALRLFQAGELERVESADVEGHWA